VCWQAPTRFEQVTYDRSWAKKQNPVNKKARAGGMPAYAPTVKERKIVEKAAGFGLPHDKICQLIVSERTGKPWLYSPRVGVGNSIGCHSIMSVGLGCARMDESNCCSAARNCW
jgi:hypothetical protein